MIQANWDFAKKNQGQQDLNLKISKLSYSSVIYTATKQMESLDYSANMKVMVANSKMTMKSLKNR